MRDWKEDVTFEIEGYDRPKGGQHVGVTPTGVWAKHKSGLVAFCNIERSQYKNRDAALLMLEIGLEATGIMSAYNRRSECP